jgi:putative FmdB family regulatory protein
VVIESADFALELSPPAWHPTGEDEQQRLADAQAAWKGFLERLDARVEQHQRGAKDPVEDWDELDYERFFRISDARNDKYGELLDKFGHSEEAHELIDQEMGWNRELDRSVRVGPAPVRPRQTRCVGPRGPTPSPPSSPAPARFSSALGYSQPPSGALGNRRAEGANLASAVQRRYDPPMPLYEFHCEKCQKESEILVRSSNWKGAKCPHCGSTRLAKKLSVFASSGGDSQPEVSCSGNPGSCGMCGTGRPHSH